MFIFGEHPEDPLFADFKRWSECGGFPYKTGLNKTRNNYPLFTSGSCGCTYNIGE
jgi:hypothetical protein